ncbi:MAG: S8 family serine peptidase [Caldilineaceae bacterium]
MQPSQKYRFILTILLMALTLAPAVQRSYPVIAAPNRDDRETTELVVKLSPDAPATYIDDLNAKYHTSTIETLLGSAAIYLLRAPIGENAKDVADKMHEEQFLVYAEPNLTGRSPEGDGRFGFNWGGEDPTAGSGQYAEAQLGLTRAHQFSQGAGVVVAVLDTGIELNHPDFAGVLVAGYDFIDDDAIPEEEKNNIDDDGDGHIDEAYGHGTHVAGIIHMVAPQAQIMPLRVLDADGAGNIFVITEAIQYAVAQGADVLNLSLGTDVRSELMKDILDDQYEHGQMIMVAAAGNLNVDQKQYPAALDVVIGVASVGQNDVKSDFSNYGDWIEVAAPGESIFSAAPPSGYAWWSGTSMSAPFVAGQAALIRSVAPTISAGSVVNHIINTVHAIDAVNPGMAGMLGRGRVDIGASLAAMCDVNGVCQAPPGSVPPSAEYYAALTSKPTDGLVGTWVIGDATFRATRNTEIKTENGPFAVGVCTKVEYWTTLSPFVAHQIRTEESSKCDGSTTPVPTPTPKPALTPTAAATATPIASQTPAATALPTAPPTAKPTTPATPAGTSTPSTPFQEKVRFMLPVIRR